MPEQAPQGPLSGAEGRAEGTQPKVGTTIKTDSYMKGERPPKPQTEPEGRAEPVEVGTSKKEEAPKKTATEESFLEEFDPTTLSEELLPAYQKLEKQFKAAFTKKTQPLAKQKEKIEAYDAAMADPRGFLQRYATQYGMKIVPADSKETASTGTGQFDPNWQPGTWDEVLQKFAPAIMTQLEEKLMGKLQPLFQNVQQMTSQTIEKQLSEIDPNWKNYEEEMSETLKLHPTLAKDPAKLYRISVPEEVLKSKYTQAALKKFEEKATSAKVHGKSSVQSSTLPTGDKLNFQQSVERAKRILAEQEK